MARASLESIKRTIRRWETEGVQPDERYRIVLAHAYVIRNGEATIGQGSEFELLMAAFAAMGVSVNRREFLRHLATMAATVAAGAFLSGVTPDLRQRAEHALAHLRLASAVAPHVVVARRRPPASLHLGSSLWPRESGSQRAAGPASVGLLAA